MNFSHTVPLKPSHAFFTHAWFFKNVHQSFRKYWFRELHRPFNVDISSYHTFKKSHLLSPLISFLKIIKNWKAYQAHGVKSKFLKIVLFNWKNEFDHCNKYCQLFTLMCQAHLVHFWEMSAKYWNLSNQSWSVLNFKLFFRVEMVFPKKRG